MAIFRRKYPGEDRTSYHVSILQTDSHFNAKKAAKEELKKWEAGWELDGVTWVDKERFEKGDVVGLTTI